MKVYTLHLGELGTNCFIAETGKGNCVAVDIGGDSELFLEFIKNRNLNLTKILVTHGHFDHINGIEAVRKATGADVYIHENDASMLESSEKSLHNYMSGEPFSPVSQYIVVRDNSIINDGDYNFSVMHTPGHSYGSVCYLCEDVMFSGDTLFAESIGRTDFPGSNPHFMENSLKKLKQLDKDYRVYPGHGETTTLSDEKKYNMFMNRL